ncbi:MAG: hypothetical protein U0V72_01370 [Cytophagales bacterium]
MGNFINLIFYIVMFLLTILTIYIILNYYKKSKDLIESNLNNVAKNAKKFKKDLVIKEHIKSSLSTTINTEREKIELTLKNKLQENKSTTNSDVISSINSAISIDDKDSIKIRYEEPSKILVSNPNVKSVESLPKAVKIQEKSIIEKLFVNYELKIKDNTETYPILKIPKNGCIVRSHRFGNSKRRGFKELSFQKSIEKHFDKYFIISGEVRLNTGKDTRPYEPDIAIIDKRLDKNIRIDIEIDEPYAAISRQATHCIGEDTIRDTYFVDRGWLVIRFSEFQVHTQEIDCLKYLAFVIRSIDSTISFSNELNFPFNLNHEKLWDIVMAQKWEKVKYRENYLNHEFGIIPEKTETAERDLNNQEVVEEKLVKSSFGGIESKSNLTSYNKINANIRDERISFYPENHVYLIDGIPFESASKIISKFFPEFDSYEKASKLNPNNPLFGLEIEEIIKIWNTSKFESARKGTLLHEQIEKFYLQNTYIKTDEFHLFEKFVLDHQNLNPYRTEWRIFDEDFNIAGTIDLIAKNGNDFEIYDWKRSKKVIDFNGKPIINDIWGKKGIGNLTDLPDTSYNRYCLQQSIYRYILEKKYNLKISKMYLIILHPEYTNYYKLETPYWKNRIENILCNL